MKHALGIIGISGRMGQRLMTLLESHPDYWVLGGYSRRQPHKGQRLPMETLFQQCKYIIDVSHGSLVSSIVAEAAENPKPIVVATTLEAPEKEQYYTISEKMPVIFVPNTSIVACIQRYMARLLAHWLPEEYDIDLLEYHHRYKIHETSGTAVALTETILQEKSLKDPVQPYTCGATQAPRGDRHLAVASFRSGSIPGSHTVRFTDREESISIAHEVYDPMCFARGILILLHWLNAEAPIKGFFTLENILGLTELPPSTLPSLLTLLP